MRAGLGRPAVRPARMGMSCVRKSRDSQNTHGNRTMDVEHINAIGNTLADLTERTVGLRGYL
ncbi:hypothetical protein FHT26_003423 [Rhizobacter sp. SG703]|nr:hypothetical protein [Rhizobacter sp. SG703]